MLCSKDILNLGQRSVGNTYSRPFLKFMKLVALEEHFITEDMKEAWARLGRSMHDPNTDRFDDIALKTKLEDFTVQRLQQMDASGVDVQVLSLPPPGTQNFEPTEAVALARQTNDLLATAIRQNPDRFEGFATLPVPEPLAAARELERAVSTLGFKGALLGGRSGERNLDHPDFRPIFEAAAGLRVPLYLHPQTPAPAVREVYYGGYDDALSLTFATSGWGWHIEAGIQAVRLILSGIFDLYPNLQIILGHWGETVIFYLERIDKMSRQAQHLQRPIREYVRHNFYVTPSGMFSPMYLAWPSKSWVLNESFFPPITHLLLRRVEERASSLNRRRSRSKKRPS